MDTTVFSDDYDIMGTPCSFLVGKGWGSDYYEVTPTETGFKCECEAYAVNPSVECIHIKQIKEYTSTQDEEPSLPDFDQARADFYLKQIAEVNAEIETNQQSANQQMEQISLWIDHIVNRLERRRGFYELALDSWMRVHEFKTKTLVNGTLKLRQQQPQIDISDERLVLSDKRFTRTIPSKEVVDKSALRKHVLATGEEVQGTTITLRDAKFSYTTNQPKGASSNGIR